MRIGNLKGITQPQCNSQHIISQYADDTSFTVKAEETSVDNLVGILHKFGIAFGLEIKWHKSVAYWCGQGRPLRCVGKYQWKWAANRDLSKLLGTPFGLQLELQDIGHILVNKVKSKLKYGSSTNLSLAGRTLMFWCHPFGTLSQFGLGLREFLGELKLNSTITYGLDQRIQSKHEWVGTTPVANESRWP